MQGTDLHLQQDTLQVHDSTVKQDFALAASHGGQVVYGSVPEDFPTVLRAIAHEMGSKKAVADALQISQPRVSRALKGEYTFNVKNCLRLAQVSGRSASEILRAARKPDIADLIEANYGEARTHGEATVAARLAKIENRLPVIARELAELAEPVESTRRQTSTPRIRKTARVKSA